MDLLRFDWDAQKAAANLRKHGVDFEEARSVFYDELARLIDDPDHSESEDRFVLLGVSTRLRILVVCHCTVVDAASSGSSRPARPRQGRQVPIRR